MKIKNILPKSPKNENLLFKPSLHGIIIYLTNPNFGCLQEQDVWIVGYFLLAGSDFKIFDIKQSLLRDQFKNL